MEENQKQKMTNEELENYKLMVLVNPVSMPSELTKALRKSYKENVISETVYKNILNILNDCVKINENLSFFIETDNFNDMNKIENRLYNPNSLDNFTDVFSNFFNSALGGFELYKYDDRINLKFNSNFIIQLNNKNDEVNMELVSLFSIEDVFIVNIEDNMVYRYNKEYECVHLNTTGSAYLKQILCMDDEEDGKMHLIDVDFELSV